MYQPHSQFVYPAQSDKPAASHLSGSPNPRKGSANDSSVSANSRSAPPKQFGLVLLAVALLFLITNTGLLINLTVNEDDQDPAVDLYDEDPDEGMIGPDLTLVKRQDFVYVIHADRAQIEGAGSLVTLELQGVADPVVSIPTNAQPGFVVHHFDTPRLHVEANPAGPDFYGARPSAVLRYTAADGEQRRTRLQLGEAAWSQSGGSGEHVIRYSGVQLEGKTGRFSLSMADEDAAGARAQLGGGVTRVALEVTLPRVADCGSDPADGAKCEGRLSNWPVTAEHTAQCSVMYEAVTGRSPGSSLGRLRGVESMEACMGECCARVADGCQAVTFHRNGNCWLLNRQYEANFQPAKTVQVANLVFNTVVEDPDTGAEVLEARDLALKQDMYNQVGIVCDNYAAGHWDTCGCVEGWCANEGACTATKTGAFCECRAGWLGERCEEEDSMYLAAVEEREEALTNADILCDNYAPGYWHTCRCDDSYCANQAAGCNPSPVGPICLCSPGYIGQRCETRDRLVIRSR